MEKVEKVVTKKEKPVAREPHGKNQIPGFGEDRQAASAAPCGGFQAPPWQVPSNIWEQPEQDKSHSITSGPRIGFSYYLTVSETGDIIDSNPPMTRLGSPD